MSNNTQNTNSEEVDLGNLFKIIGKGFSNLFNTLGGYIKSIFNLIILSIIFLKKNSIVLIVATGLGGVIGYYTEKENEPVYFSNMLVETNFGSGHRLYNQIHFLNTLIIEQNFNKLSEVFEINPKEASELLFFDVKPYNIETNIKMEYDYYIQHTDTIYTQDFLLKDFTERIANPDFRYQMIVASSRAAKFNHLKGGISSLVENKMYKKLYNIKNAEFNLRREVINKDIVAIDSLRKLYKKIALLHATKTSKATTNIDLGSKTSKMNMDIELFKEKIINLELLENLNVDVARSDFIMNIVSDFSRGRVDSNFKNKNWYNYAILGFSFALFVLLAFKINKFLNKYEKSHQ